MTGEGWVWIGSDGVAASWVAFDKDVKTAAQGLVAIAPKSEFSICLHKVLSTGLRAYLKL